MVLKELIFNSFYFGQVGGIFERTDFVTIGTLGGCVVLKELILNSFYTGTVWRWSLKLN